MTPVQTLLSQWLPGIQKDKPCKARVWHQGTEPPWVPRPHTGTRTSRKVLELCTEFLRGKVDVRKAEAQLGLSKKAPVHKWY